MSTRSTQSTILVAVDGSPESDAAVVWAARESVLREAPVTLMHVIAPVLVSLPVEPMFRVPGWYENSARHLLRHAERDFQSSLAQPLAGDLHLAIDHGNPVGRLVEATKDTQMVVVGSRGLGAFGRPALGSVSAGLLHHAHCPVAVIRAGASSHGVDAPVVVGIDGSPASEDATALAFDEASRRGVDLVALLAWSDVDVYSVLGDDWRDLETRATDLLNDRLGSWQELYPGTLVHRRVVCDNAAHSLTEESSDAQLVVVGSRGRGRFARTLLGSTSSSVVRRSSAPVIVVRNR
jgi:nucleotide-binding universal stress UspA family protein